MKSVAIPVALALVALGGQGATASAPGAAQASRTAAVNIDHFKYRPAALTVSQGTTIVFSNSAPVAHTVTDRGAFDSGRIKPGRSFSVHFGRKGTFAYHCKIHRFMRGKVFVR
jgi:plastocyanin